MGLGWQDLQVGDITEILEGERKNMNYHTVRANEKAHTKVMKLNGNDNIHYVICNAHSIGNTQQFTLQWDTNRKERIQELQQDNNKIIPLQN